ncbi:hypothetical protein P4O66_014517, partial [Electrophorus voltai]
SQQQLRGVRYFKLDLLSVYNLIWIREGDEWKTPTSSGHYEYLVPPYGLTMVPSTFQAYINEVLRKFLDRSVFAIPPPGTNMFIKSFSTLARPLTDLLREQAKQIKWTAKAEKSFEYLKTAFSTTWVLQQPDQEKPFSWSGGRCVGFVSGDVLDLGVE